MEPTKISSPQGTQPAQGTRPRSTAQGQDANNVPAGGGGFLALLASLGDAPQGDNAVLDLASSTAVAGDDAAQGVVDASALAAWQGLLAPGADARVDAGAGDSQAGGMLRAGRQDAAGGLGTGAQGDSASMANALAGMGGLPQGMVAETATLDTSAERRLGLPQAGGTAYGRAFSRMQSALAQKSDALDMATGRSVAGGATQQLTSHQGQFLTAVHSGSERMMVMGTEGAGALERIAVGSVDPAAGSVSGFAIEGLLSPVASARAGDGADGGGRSGEGRSGAAAWLEGGGGSAPVESGSGDGGAVFADPAQAVPEDQVAEQVAYWVNQKTQNAELTLNSDGQPVEVSVSLSGNEAHVTFRSDQQQTRELLDRSMAQLSDLLRSEGLVLSGMSVGTSAGQRENSGASERQGQREGARQAQVVAAAPSGTASLLRGGSPDRSVDIFV